MSEGVNISKNWFFFKAFTGGLRKYLHYYRACVLSTPPTLSLLTIGFLFRKVGRQLRWAQPFFLMLVSCVNFTPFKPQPHPAEYSRGPTERGLDANIIGSKTSLLSFNLRYLSELCCVNGPLGAGQAAFPVVRPLLSTNCNMSAIMAVLSLSDGMLAQPGCVYVALLRVLNCCPTCTMKHRITAAMKTIRSCCRCWRAAVNLTHGRFLFMQTQPKDMTWLACRTCCVGFPGAVRTESARFCCALRRFVSDWVYSGVFRDVYGEFMIQVNEEYLSFRGENTHTRSHL